MLLLERRPNHAVRDGLRDADIVAEQFLVGYGLLAVEGMASGAAVISNIGWLPDELREHPAIAESPIVDASPETLTDRLRELVLDHERREQLGSRGRAYVLRWHSDAAAAEMWHSIVDAVWRARPYRGIRLRGSRASAERSSGAVSQSRHSRRVDVARVLLS